MTCRTRRRRAQRLQGRDLPPVALAPPLHTRLIFYLTRSHASPARKLMLRCRILLHRRAVLSRIVIPNGREVRCSGGAVPCDLRHRAISSLRNDCSRAAPISVSAAEKPPRVHVSLVTAG